MSRTRKVGRLGAQPARAIVRPGGEKLPPFGEQIRSSVSAFDLAAYQMGEAHLRNFGREVDLLRRPVARKLWTIARPRAIGDAARLFLDRPAPLFVGKYVGALRLFDA